MKDRSMFRKFLFPVWFAALVSATPAYSQSLEVFAPEKICVGEYIDKKLFMQAALGLDKCDKTDDCTSQEKIDKVVNLLNVRRFLRVPDDRYPGRFRLKNFPAGLIS